MKKASLSVKIREGRGKGAARRLRISGMTPAVFYGRTAENLSLAVPTKELKSIISSETGTSTFLKLSLDGKDKTEKLAIIKDIQSDPVTDMPIHVDLYELLMDEEITASIPVRLTGKAQGVELGGTLQPIRRELEVRCLPKHLPDAIEVDITDLGIGQSIHIDDIKLPSGVEVPHDVNFTVVVVVGQRGAEEAEEEAGEAEAAEEAEEAEVEK